MASLNQSTDKQGRLRFRVDYRDELTGGGRRRTFYNIDEAAEFFWRVEDSALNWRTAEIAETRKAWTLQKLVYFFLGFQCDKLNRNVIKHSSYKKCRADLLAADSHFLKKNIMQVSTRELAQALTPGAQRWIHAAFNLLLKKKVITFNPQQKPKSRQRKPITVPRKAAVKKLLTDSPTRERIACWLGAVCGMRIGEILALNYADIDEKFIQVRKHITPEGQQAGLKRGIQRRVKMPRGLFSLLDPALIGTSSPLIANARTGSRLGLGYSNQGGMSKLLAAHDIKRFHDLRHFAVSRLAERGTDILTVSRMIGHAHVSTTMDIYGHLFGDTPDLDFDD